jgi:hypothetical protein
MLYFKDTNYKGEKTMKKYFKKLLATALVVIMTMTAFTVSTSAWFDDAFPFDFVTKDGVSYLIETETMTASVTGYEIDEEGNTDVPAELVIPSEIEYNGKNYPVRIVSDYAFVDCPTLRKITLPETIEYMGSYAFENAAYLETVIIPETIEFTEFGSNVFDYTPAMGYLAENTEDGAVILGQNVLFAYIGNADTYVVPDEIDIIAENCFFLSGVGEIILNSSITEIRPYTFASCRNLKEITIPEQVMYIGPNAFSNCTSLEKITLSDSLQSIGEKAFEGTAIKEIYLGDSIFNIMGAFAGCETIEKITVSENNKDYFTDGNALFFRSYDYDGEEVVHTDELYLEYFIINSDLTSYTVPSDVVFIGDYAFYNNKTLTEVKITSPVYVGICSFAYCKFESFDFSNVTEINHSAFKGCRNLTSADLSNTEYIYDSAFENCTSLADVTFGENLGVIGSRAFANTAVASLDIGGDTNEIYEGAFVNCPELTRVNFNNGVSFIDSLMFTNCPKLERVYIGEDIEYIADNAFDTCPDNTVFEVIKHSNGCDHVEENGLNYEIVGKVSFFKRVVNFFTDLFERVRDFFLSWIIY